MERAVHCVYCKNCVWLPISQKIDVNAPIDGRVLLHYAADYGQTAVLNYLLDKGADPNVSCFV